MIIDVIRDQLKLLRMPGAPMETEKLVQKGKRNQYLKCLSELLTVELDARADNAIEKRIKRVEFPERRSFEQFNWYFNKKSSTRRGRVVKRFKIYREQWNRVIPWKSRNRKESSGYRTWNDCSTGGSQRLLHKCEEAGNKNQKGPREQQPRYFIHANINLKALNAWWLGCCDDAKRREWRNFWFIWSA